MTPPNSAFPWFFFWKVARLFLGVQFLTWATLAWWEPSLPAQVWPVFTAAAVIFLSGFAVFARPLSDVLRRVGRIVQAELPHEQQLDLFYMKDEWAKIDAALAEADRRSRDQLRTIREENRKFTTLLDSLPNEILAIDPSLNVLFYNPRFLRTFLAGRPQLQERGKLWSMLEHAEAAEVFRRVVEDGHPQRLAGFPLTLAGETRYYKLVVSPLPTAGGTGAVGVFTDVTDAKRTEQMRVDFVANVSHEIRTPLTSIKGYTQVLKSQRAQIGAELHGFLDKILHNTERMIALFNDLLGLSVLESRDRIQIEEISLSEVLDHVEATMRALHRDKDFQLTRTLGTNVLRADPKLFEQVLTNLVDNACKYAIASPRVNVEACSEGDSVVLTVTDNGPGIGKEHLPRVFERFYRVDSSRERTTGGTGLGLAIVKHIVAKHQGHIHAESDGVNGTTFVVRLPA
jgi:two-component system phosphate regulon sensor histidine kinase PhoR